MVAGLFVISACSSPEAYRWEIVHEEPDVSFRGIAAVSDSVCWVSGSRGTILRTTDGGKRWEQRTIAGADSLDFRDIEAFSRDTAVAMSIGSGRQSRVYRTTDGGSSWNLVQQNQYREGFYDAIAFWDNRRGILQGDPLNGRLYLMTTDDGGRSWQEIPQTQMPPVEEGEYAFAASGTQLVTGPNGQAWIGTGGAKARVLYSQDYGRSWHSFDAPIIQGEPSTGIFSLAFAEGHSYGIAVGGDYTKEEEGTDNVIYTEDGGAHWKLLREASLPYRSAVRYTGGYFITVGPSGSEYSNDRGKTWHPIQGPGFHTLDTGPGGMKAVWAAGRDGRVGRLIQE